MFVLFGIIIITGLYSCKNSVLKINITLHENNSSYFIGEEIEFKCNADDDKDIINESDIIWTSDFDGLLGTGSSVKINTLSVNDHIITVKTTDANTYLHGYETPAIFDAISTNEIGIKDGCNVNIIGMI